MGNGDFSEYIKNILEDSKESRPLFFDHNTIAKYVTDDMRLELENHFPTQHYGEDISTFEAWSLRSILLQAMAIGAWLEHSKIEKMRSTIESISE